MSPHSQFLILRYPVTRFFGGWKCRGIDGGDGLPRSNPLTIRVIASR